MASTLRLYLQSWNGQAMQQHFKGSRCSNETFECFLCPRSIGVVIAKMVEMTVVDLPLVF